MKSLFTSALFTAAASAESTYYASSAAPVIGSSLTPTITTSIGLAIDFDTGNEYVDQTYTVELKLADSNSSFEKDQFHQVTTCIESYDTSSEKYLCYLIGLLGANDKDGRFDVRVNKLTSLPFNTSSAVTNDSDLVKNVYKIDDDGNVTLDTASGDGKDNFTLDPKLDIESKNNSWKLKMVYRLSYSDMSKASVGRSIMKEDMAHVFTQTLYQASAIESSTNTNVVYMEVATNPDSGDNDGASAIGTLAVATALLGAFAF